jgi:Tfp pilus assembly protein PilE
MKRPFGLHTTGGFTIVEAAFASAIIAVALASMFAFNSACLSLVRNAKESAEAMLSNQQRVEQLRSCNWSALTDSSYWSDTANNTSYWLTNIMDAPTQSGAALSTGTEVVQVTENGFLQGASAASFQVTRTPAGPSLTSSDHPEKLVTARMLKVSVTLNWTTLGGRSRTRTSTAIIAKGGLTINETTTIAPSVQW